MTSSLIGEGSSHCLRRSSGRPFVYGPSLACRQRVSQVSMGTMVWFLANASISPQTGSGNLGAGEWSEAYQSTWTLLALPSRVFLCWRPPQGATLQPQLRRLCSLRLSYAANLGNGETSVLARRVASGLYQALAPAQVELA